MQTPMYKMICKRCGDILRVWREIERSMPFLVQCTNTKQQHAHGRWFHMSNVTMHERRDV